MTDSRIHIIYWDFSCIKVTMVCLSLLFLYLKQLTAIYRNPFVERKLDKFHTELKSGVLFFTAIFCTRAHISFVDQKCAILILFRKDISWCIEKKYVYGLWLRLIKLGLSVLNQSSFFISCLVLPSSFASPFGQLVLMHYLIAICECVISHVDVNQHLLLISFPYILQRVMQLSPFQTLLSVTENYGLLKCYHMLLERYLKGSLVA